MARRQRGSSKDLRAILDQIEEAGGRPRYCKGHWKVYYQGKFIGTVCSTPSDWRSWKNDIATLKRRGLPL